MQQPRNEDTVHCYTGNQEPVGSVQTVIECKGHPCSHKVVEGDVVREGDGVEESGAQREESQAAQHQQVGGEETDMGWGGIEGAVNGCTAHSGD
jgi:hypothetical protein